VLMVGVWALATVVLATFLSAALGQAGFAQIDFRRALPVVLVGEGLIYILVLGGGLVPGPILLVAVALAFVLRAAIAVLTTELAPPGRVDNLLVAAQYYYASCWPAAGVQILLVVLLLRLSRRVLARGRRARRPARWRAGPDTDEMTGRREHLIAVLTEAPDAPPRQGVGLPIEEQQIGDLAEVEVPAIEQPAVSPELDIPLPLMDEAGAQRGVANVERDQGQTRPVAATPLPLQATGEPTREGAYRTDEGPEDTGEDTEALEPLRPEP